MNEWSYKLDKVQAQSKMNISSEGDKKVVNISNEPANETEESRVLEINYPELFTKLSEQSEIPVLVPLHSSWFSIYSIHPIEKRFFSAFLSGEGSNERYVRIRNRIFKMFQDNTKNHLSITQCRKCISEDISTIIKIYSFLEHWGLINYKIGVKREIGKLLEKIQQKDLYDIKKGSAVAENSKKAEGVLKEEKDIDKEGGGIDKEQESDDMEKHHGAMMGKGESEQKDVASTEQDNYNLARTYPSMDKYIVVGDSTIPVASTNLSVQKPVTDMLRDSSKHFSLQSNGVVQNSIPSELFCTSCNKLMNISSAEEKIYFSEKGKVVLCVICFNRGKYPSTYSYADFHLLKSRLIRQLWTEKEEMLLIEGIEMYKDDWKAVAEYVKTKTLEQCVLHFLKMGIQDPFLEMKAISFSENKMPFNYTLNPVMSTVAFLASAVHPGVASAAAKAAVNEIYKESLENKSEDGWLNDRLNEIAAVALSSCLSRAHEQKLLEEGKKERLLELLVESEMKRVDLKVSEFTDLARTLKKEREDLEKMRETYRKAHLETRKEIAEVVSKLRKVCDETGKNFEEIFFKE